MDTTVLLTDLQPGNYYFICSIAGHCDAGMKIEVIVLPSDNEPTLLNPAVAICNDPNGCSYVYSASDTPQLIDIQVDILHVCICVRIMYNIICTTYVHSTLVKLCRNIIIHIHIPNKQTCLQTPTTQINKQTINYRTPECPALRTGVRWVKDLLWLGNSPHTFKYSNQHTYIRTVTHSICYNNDVFFHSANHWYSWNRTGCQWLRPHSSQLFNFHGNNIDWPRPLFQRYHSNNFRY